MVESLAAAWCANILVRARGLALYITGKGSLDIAVIEKFDLAAPPWFLL